MPSKSFRVIDLGIWFPPEFVAILLCPCFSLMYFGTLMQLHLYLILWYISDKTEKFLKSLTPDSANLICQHCYTFSFTEHFCAIGYTLQVRISGMERFFIKTAMSIEITCACRNITNITDMIMKMHLIRIWIYFFYSNHYISTSLQ